MTGGAGLLGAALLRSAPGALELHATQRRTPARGATAHTVELADREATLRLFDAVRPELVIHTAYTMAAGERDIVAATRHVVEGVESAGAALVHLSTDALLDGESGPYDESAEPAPVHEYGRHKAEAELLVRGRLPAAAVVRTSLLVSLHPLDPRSAWVAAGVEGRETVRLFADELRCPTLVDDLAAQLWELAALPPPARAGVWHLAGPEALSRYALGVLLAGWLGRSPAPLVPTLSSDHPGPRPRDLRLLTRRADAALRARARPISQALAEARLAAHPPRA